MKFLNNILAGLLLGLAALGAGATVEVNPQYPADLNATYPGANDPKLEGDDHLRNIKTALKNALAGFPGAAVVTADDAGVANAYALTPTPALPSYTTGTLFVFKALNANTGAATLNVSGLGAKSIKTISGADPGAGEISGGTLVRYDGTNMVLYAGSSYLAKTGGAQTVTGTITFTASPQVPTAAPGTSNTTAASTAFVAAQAFSSTLPAQTGNAGKFVTTDGSTASWQLPIAAQTGNGGKFLTTDGSTTSWALASANFTYTARNSGTNASLTAANFASATRIYLEWTGSTAFTQAIDALSGIAEGGFVPFRNSSSATITIDPNGAETINGASSIKVYPGESGFISKESGGFHVHGLTPVGGAVQIAKQTASSSATLDFANLFTSDFDSYRIKITKLKPATDVVNLYLRTSTDGGATYDSAASAYNYAVANFGATYSGSTSTTATQVQLTNATIGNSTQEWVTLTIEIEKPLDVANATMTWSGHMIDDGGSQRAVAGTGMRMSAADIDSFRLFFSSGNIASGEVIVTAIKK